MALPELPEIMRFQLLRFYDHNGRHYKDPWKQTPLAVTRSSGFYYLKATRWYMNSMADKANGSLGAQLFEAIFSLTFFLKLGARTEWPLSLIGTRDFHMHTLGIINIWYNSLIIFVCTTAVLGWCFDISMTPWWLPPRLGLLIEIWDMLPSIHISVRSWVMYMALKCDTIWCYHKHVLSCDDYLFHHNNNI